MGYKSKISYDIMMQCWSEDPKDRPAFEELKETFLDVMAGDYYLDVFDKATYKSHLYKPERFASDSDPPVDLLDPVPTPCKDFSSESDLPADLPNLLQTTVKRCLSESDLSTYLHNSAKTGLEPSADLHNPPQVRRSDVPFHSSPNPMPAQRKVVSEDVSSPLQAVSDTRF